MSSLEWHLIPPRDSFDGVTKHIGYQLSYDHQNRCITIYDGKELTMAQKLGFYGWTASLSIGYNDQVNNQHF